MLIRQYISEDFERIMAFWRQECSGELSEEEYRTYYSRTDKEHFVVEYAGEIIAALSFTEIRFKNEPAMYLYIMANSDYYQKEIGFECYRFVLEKLLALSKAGREVKFLQACCDEKDLPIVQFLTRLGGEMVYFYETMYMELNNLQQEYSISEPYQLVPFSSQDVEEYYWLERDIFTGYFTYHPKSLDDFRTILFSPNFQNEGLFIIKKDQELVAFCRVHYNLHDRMGSIQLLGVKEEHRGHGLGSNLLVHALTYLKNIGALRACLAVDGSDEPTVSLYKRIGFTTSRRRYILQKPFDATLVEQELKKLLIVTRID